MCHFIVNVYYMPIIIRRTRTSSLLSVLINVKLCLCCGLNIRLLLTFKSTPPDVFLGKGIPQTCSKFTKCDFKKNHKKGRFVKYFFGRNLFTFTEEILNVKLPFCVVALFMLLLIHRFGRNDVWSF